MMDGIAVKCRVPGASMIPVLVRGIGPKLGPR
jgi:hypothetical protein